jgi:polysaccharide biosynthesis/export protein
MRKPCLIFLILLITSGAILAQKPESLAIGPGDLLHIQIFDTAELEQHVRVTDDGKIALLVGGDVKVDSLTPEQAARRVEEVLVEGHYLLHPRASVLVEEYSTQKVSIFGEVKVPGAYQTNTSRSILDVLTLAGGLTDLADRKVLIQRAGSDEKVPYFISNNAGEAIDTRVFVNPGDTIVVPRAELVYVLGDVKAPGAYTMTNNSAKLTVVQLVARAGGTDHTAVTAKTHLIHSTPNGYVEEQIPLGGMQEGRKPDIALRPDDIVYVPFSYMRNLALNLGGLVANVGSAAVYRF